MKNITNNTIINCISTLALFASVALLLYSGYIFMIGFHNADMNQNHKIMQNDLNLVLSKSNVNRTLEYVETTNTGNYITFSDAYTLGIRQIFRGAFLMIAGAFAFGITLVMKFNDTQELIDKIYKRKN